MGKKNKVRQDHFECHGICRICGLEHPTPARDFLHASPPRCSSCGGMLDKKWRRERVGASPSASTQKRGHVSIGHGKGYRARRRKPDKPKVGIR